MKLGEVVVIHVYYNFTKFHQNRMTNKKVLLIARFSVQNFKVSVELWKSYIVQSRGGTIRVGKSSRVESTSMSSLKSKKSRIESKSNHLKSNQVDCFFAKVDKSTTYSKHIFERNFQIFIWKFNNLGMFFGYRYTI